MRKIILVGLVLTILLALTSVTSAAPPLLKVQGSGVVTETNIWYTEPFRMTFSVQQIDDLENAQGMVRITGLTNDWYESIDVSVLVYDDSSIKTQAHMAGVITRSSNEEHIDTGFYGIVMEDTPDWVAYTIGIDPSSAIEYAKEKTGFADFIQVQRGNINIR